MWAVSCVGVLCQEPLQTWTYAHASACGAAPHGELLSNSKVCNALCVQLELIAGCAGLIGRWLPVVWKTGKLAVHMSSEQDMRCFETAQTSTGLVMARRLSQLLVSVVLFFCPLAVKET